MLNRRAVAICLALGLAASSVHLRRGPLPRTTWTTQPPLRRGERELIGYLT